MQCNVKTKYLFNVYCLSYISRWHLNQFSVSNIPVGIHWEKYARISAFSDPYFLVWGQNHRKIRVRENIYSCIFYSVNRRFSPYMGKYGSQKTFILADFTQWIADSLLTWEKTGQRKNLCWYNLRCDYVQESNGIRQTRYNCVGVFSCFKGNQVFIFQVNLKRNG